MTEQNIQFYSPNLSQFILKDSVVNVIFAVNGCTTQLTGM